ncbi:MAG: thioredoxin family protein [Verrucomicrobia bacterium]|nr:thioredoxin family protein [Verrucomicrobiota bacterium]
MKKLILSLLLLATVTVRAELTWLSDLEEAKKVATKENKKLLVDFTGSDWCGYCIKLHKEVFDTPEFEKFAKDFVLVELDFPKRKEQPAAEKTKNQAAQKKYSVNGFPTVLILTVGGKVLNRAEGYSPDSGPSAYLPQLGAPAVKKVKAPTPTKK